MAVVNQSEIRTLLGKLEACILLFHLLAIRDFSSCFTTFASFK